MRRIEKFGEWLAQYIAFNLLPRRVTYWAAIRLGANAAVGEHQDQIVPDLMFTEALRRWQ